MNKLNELLKNVSCDETCRRDKELANLKQEMMDAEVNIETAPQQLDRIKKKYFTLLKGAASYNEMRTEELKKEADKMISNLKDKFQQVVIGYHTRVGQNHVLTKSLNDNKKYLKMLSDKKNAPPVMMTSTSPIDTSVNYKVTASGEDPLTLNRVLEYERRKYTSTKAYYNYMSIFYNVLLFFIIVLLYGLKNSFSETEKIILIVFIILYKWGFMYVLTFIIYVFTGLKSIIPKNMYLGEYTAVSV
jgi:hypothetical protein